MEILFLVFALGLVSSQDRFPRPVVPLDNPMTAAKIELGRHLFYDRRLSGNGRQSCATCHRQELAFTDGRARAVGSTGELHPRSAMSLVNVAYNATLTWMDPELTSLEAQALIPLFGKDPVEMGSQEKQFLELARGDHVYRRLFPESFTDRDLYTITNIVKAIAAFERTIVSFRAPYDRYRYEHDETAISDAAKRGELLYFSGESGACFQCHGGFNFSGPARFEGDAAVRQRNGRSGFRVPTLRNIVLTAPYMHDGSIATLEGALSHDSSRGRVLNDREKRDLLEFLATLTDEEVTRNPRWSDPWPQPGAKGMPGDPE